MTSAAATSPSTRATPRSVSTGRPSAVKTMLPGERSPWTTPLRVRVGQRGGDRRDGRDHLPRPQPSAAGEQRGEAAALQQFEDERNARGSAAARLVHDLDQPDQVRMVELAEQRRLARLPLGVAVDQHLDGDGRSTAPRDGAPHLAGPTAPEQRLEDVPGDDGRVGGAGRIGCGHDRER